MADDFKFEKKMMDIYIPTIDYGLNSFNGFK